MLKNILYIIILAAVVSCGNNNSQATDESYDLSSLKGLKWYQMVLETENLNEINIKDTIPDNFISYLKSIDSNFRMASEGEMWQAGCTPPIIFDSANSETYRDEETGELITIIKTLDVDAPMRKLVYFDKNEKMAALLYMSGGIGVMQHLVLFKIDNGMIIEHWHGNTSGDIRTQNEILNKIVALPFIGQ